MLAPSRLSLRSGAGLPAGSKLWRKRMSLREPVILREICVSVMPWARVRDSWLGVRLELHLEMCRGGGQWPMNWSFSEKLAFHKFVFSYEKCSVSNPKKKKKKNPEENRTKTVEALMIWSNLYKSSLIWKGKTEQAGNENIVDNFTSFILSTTAFSLLAKTLLMHQRNPCKSCSLELDGCRKGGLIGGKKTNTAWKGWASEWLSLRITYTL